MPAPGPGGWLRLALRLPVLAVVVLGGLALHLALRLVERPLFGLRRPVTPWVTQGVCRAALVILGLRLDRRGRPMRRRGAIVANHAGWLDIFTLNAATRIYFVSKSEVATWPLIGTLARVTGTVFINRDARDARLQKEIFEARLRVGHRLAFFPEGTSTDGLRVLPFKTTLFAAFFAQGLADDMAIQPVSMAYLAPGDADPRLYGWFGDMSFGAHLLFIAAQPRRGRVVVIFHPPADVRAYPDRKALARHCEQEVRKGLRQTIPAQDWRDSADLPGAAPARATALAKRSPAQ
jgi:1-acyl-sn-glycerol-3-phosphate acyltransferase